MKKKLMSLFLGLAVTLCLCGCDADDLPDMLSYPLTMAKSFTAEGDIEIKTVDNSIMDKCFEKIKAGPVILTLPMNVSDLPEDIVCKPEKYEEQGVNTYNGMKLLTMELYIGESSFGYAKILCADTENYADGVILSLMFFSNDINISLGDVSLNMSYKEISETMGCGTEAGGTCVYVSDSSRSVYFSDLSYYSNTEEEEEKEYPDFVCISAEPELYVNYTITM